MFLALLALGLAARRPAVATRYSKHNSNAFACDMCTQVVNYIEQLMVDQTIESEIEGLVEQLCEQFPSPYSSICDSLVEQYVPVIMQWIEEDIASLDICSMLGLCSSPKGHKARMGKPVKFAPNGFACTMCTQIVDYIEQLIVDSTVEDQIAQLVAQFCENFPTPYSTLCDSLVETYIPDILKWIEQGLESLDVCVNIGLCTHDTKVNVHRAMKRRIPLPKKLSAPKNDNGYACEMCTKVVQYIEQIMKDTTVDSEVAKLVELLCQEFPSPYSTLCNSIVEQFVPVIMQWLSEGFEYLDICNSIGLCTQQTMRLPRIQMISHRRAALPRVQKRLTGSAQDCEECIRWFGWFEEHLLTMTEEALWMAIHDECPKVPVLKYFCQIINYDNIETAFELIRNAIPPEQCCIVFGACSNENNTVVKGRNGQRIALPRPQRRMTGSAQDCEECVRWFGWFEKNMLDLTEDALWMAIHDECPKVDVLKYFCEYISYDNVHYVFELISNAIPPEECCIVFGACPSSNATKVPSRRVALPKPQKVSTPSAEGCDACVRWFGWFEKNFFDMTEDALWLAIHEECPKVEAIKGFCELITIDNLDFVFSLLRSELPPEQCCIWFNACEEPTNHF